MDSSFLNAEISGGAFMMTVFYILPDYYYLPLSLYGRILYGASIGILTEVCRLCGPWQEAVAYVCLLLGFIYSLWRFCQIRFRK